MVAPRAVQKNMRDRSWPRMRSGWKGGAKELVVLCIFLYINSHLNEVFDWVVCMLNIRLDQDSI